MRPISRLAARSLLLVLFMLACGPRVDNSRVQLPPPLQSTTLGPGDVFSLEIVGEKDLPKDYQVASDGSVDFPYVHRLQVLGLEPQEIARGVRDQLMQQRILTDPSVIVSVKEYNSKRVTVLGEVRKPGSFPLTPGMTLVQAISNAGGLTAIANGERVNLTRSIISAPGARDVPAAPKARGASTAPPGNGPGTTTTVVISLDAITAGRSPDIPLQSGDQIYVNERVF